MEKIGKDRDQKPQPMWHNCITHYLSRDLSQQSVLLPRCLTSE